MAMLFLLCRQKYHRNSDGSLSRQKLATVLLLSASTYTFTVAFVSEIILHGPNLSAIFRDGFGDGRVAWLLFGVIIETGMRIWDEYRAQ